jgi:hypothetical protein
MPNHATYYDDLIRWVHSWKGQVLRLRLDADSINRVERCFVDAIDVVNGCRLHGSRSYQEAHFPPMPRFDQQEETAVIQPQVITHSIEDMMAGLRRMQAELLTAYANSLPPIRLTAHDHRNDDLADAVSYAMNGIFQSTAVAQIRWSEPGDPERWPEGLPDGDQAPASRDEAAQLDYTRVCNQRLEEARLWSAAEERAQRWERGAHALGRVLDGVEQPATQSILQRAMENVRGILEGGIIDPAGGLGATIGGMLGVFGRRTPEQQAALEQERAAYGGGDMASIQSNLEQLSRAELLQWRGLDPARYPRAAKIAKIMASSTPPTWLELRRLAEDGEHPAVIMSICRTHGMEYLEPTGQLRQENDDQADDQVVDAEDNYEIDEEELGVETDEMLGMGDAETWIRERLSGSDA